MSKIKASVLFSAGFHESGQSVKTAPKETGFRLTNAFIFQRDEIMTIRNSAATLSVAALLMAAAPASAADISIALPDDTEATEISTLYDCGDFELSARYINADEVSIAVLDWPENFIVTANVISGSGARYAGGPYIWWVKGDEASLENQMSDDDPLTCKTTED